MTEKRQEKSIDFQIDFVAMFQFLLSKIWIIILATVIGGIIAIGYAKYGVQEQYSASTLVCINNKTVSLGSVSISAGDISASKSLVSIYTVLLKSRTTLEMVAEEAGSKLSWQAISGMISATAVDETQFLRISVQSTDPNVSMKIANAIAVILPKRVAEIFESTSVTVVDTAVFNPTRVYPTYTNFAITGLGIGLLISVAILVIIALLDNTIHDTEYLLRTYEYPILATVSDFEETSHGRYGKYGHNGKYGRYYYSKGGQNGKQNSQ